jgi:hypothetical protein
MQLQPEAFRSLHHLEHVDFYNNPRLLALSLYHPALNSALYYIPSEGFTNLGLASNELIQVTPPHYGLPSGHHLLAAMYLNAVGYQADLNGFWSGFWTLLRTAQAMAIEGILPVGWAW